MLDPADDQLPEDASRDFLTDIRSTWLTTATSAEPKSGATAARPRKPRPLFEVDYLASFNRDIRSIGRSAREAFSSLVGMVSDGLRERAKTGLVLGLLAAVMILGALVYEVVVNFILDPSTVPAVTQGDSSRTPTAARSPVEAYLPPVSAAVPANASTAASADLQGAAERTDAVAGKLSVAGVGHTVASDGDKAAHIADGREISGQNDQRAGLAGDGAVPLTEVANTMAQKARDAQAAQMQSAAEPLSSAQAPVVVANASVADVERTPSGPRNFGENAGGDSVANSAGGAAYLDLVRAGERALKSNDLPGAYKLAAQAKALNPGNPAALELMQGVFTAAGDSGDAQAAALDSIAHGGSAAFELQTVGAQPSSLRPARIVITATSLQFVPEAAQSKGAIGIALASITSVQMSRNVSEQILTVRYNDAKSGAEEISLTDVSGESTAGRSQSSPAQRAALLGAIRNVILTTRSRSRLVH